MAYRVRLTKKWKNLFGREYPVGTVLQTDAHLGSDLIRLKYGVEYDGKYPPDKAKINLSDLEPNNKQ
jgi:hypothetical protein